MKTAASSQRNITEVVYGVGWNNPATRAVV